MRSQYTVTKPMVCIEGWNGGLKIRTHSSIFSHEMNMCRASPLPLDTEEVKHLGVALDLTGAPVFLMAICDSQMAYMRCPPSAELQ
jgi:hypothetical protein